MALCMYVITRVEDIGKQTHMEILLSPVKCIHPSFFSSIPPQQLLKKLAIAHKSTLTRIFLSFAKSHIYQSNSFGIRTFLSVVTPIAACKYSLLAAFNFVSTSVDVYTSTYPLTKQKIQICKHLLLKFPLKNIQT